MSLPCWLFLVVCLALPGVVDASLGISEVAWMGTSASANYEWIELHNSGSEAVSVEGWTLTDSNTLSIELSGSVGSGSYAVLERTSDESASGVALLVYTGALVNTGTTLTLRDESGAIIDQVVGGENWELLGGSNVTKETAQYSGSRWLTAPATPGAVNATSGSAPGTEATTQKSGNSSSGNLLRQPEKETVKLELANVSLALTIDAPEVVYAGQRVPFTVNASGPNKVVLDSLEFEWNFGDTSTGAGRRTSHRYLYPGEYVLTVHGAYGRHEQVARATLTVLPVALSLTTDEDGNVQVNNDAPYEVILSGYALTGAETMVLPPRTVLLPRATITVSRERLGRNYAGDYALRDAAGRLVADTAPSTEDEELAESLAHTVDSEHAVFVAPPVAVSPEKSEFTFAELLPAPIEVAAAAGYEVAAVQQAEATKETSEPLRADRNLLGLAALMTLAVCALLVSRKDKVVKSNEI